MTTKQYSAVIIGGLIFNHEPLIEVFNLFQEVHFIDINGLTFLQAQNQVLKLVKTAKYPVVLIGYSTGGLIALTLCKQLLNKVKLILINSTPYFMEDKNWQGISNKNYVQLVNKFNNLSVTGFIQHFLCLSIFPYVKQYSKCQGFISQSCTKANIEYWLEVVKNYDLRDELNKCSYPIIILFASKDSIVPAKINLNNPLVNQVVMSDSSHVILNTTSLTDEVKKFILC